MEYQRLGQSELKVSRIGMGCWALGGKKWGPVNDDDSIAAIRAGLDEGINFFDTADYYGLGHSEEILGKVLEGRRKEVILATKVGLRWNKRGNIRHDLSPDYIFQACDESLRRLKTEWIDLYQIHWPDPNTPLGKTVEAMEKLVTKGKVRYIGGGNLEGALLNEAAKSPFFVSLQAPYNLFNREVEKELVPWCKKQNIGLIGYEPLFKGILTGKFKTLPHFPLGDQRKWDARFSPEHFSFYQEAVGRVEIIGRRYGKTCAQVSLALLLENSAVTAIIPGAKTKEHVIENAGAIKLLTDEKLLSKIGEETKEALGFQNKPF